MTIEDHLIIFGSFAIAAIVMSICFWVNWDLSIRHKGFNSKKPKTDKEILDEQYRSLGGKILGLIETCDESEKETLFIMLRNHCLNHNLHLRKPPKKIEVWETKARSEFEKLWTRLRKEKKDEEQVA